jgi:hypothetical protein
MFSFITAPRRKLGFSAMPSSYLLALSVLFTQVSAQRYYDDYYYYRRSRRNRIIGGVIGAIGIFLIVLGLFLMARRRRNSRISAYTGPHVIATGGGRPMTGAAHNHSTNNPYVGGTPQHGQGEYGGQYPQGGAGYGGYDAGAPPPPYAGAKDVEANPAGAHTDNRAPAGGFAPPSGPPPPAQAHFAQ